MDSLLERLERLFSPRPTRPTAYRRRFGLARRVRRAFLEVGQELPDCLPGDDLLLAQVIVTSGQEMASLERLIELSGPKVALGLPARPLDIGPLLEAMPSDPLPAEVAAVRSRIRQELVPANFRWFYRGRPVKAASRAGSGEFLSHLLEQVYADTPVHLPRTGRRRLLLSCRELLDLGSKLALPKPGWGNEPLSALLAAGLMDELEDHGSYGVYRVTRESLSAEPDQRLLAELLEWLYGDYTDQAPAPTLRETLDWLAEPPRGLRGPWAKLYLCLALGCHVLDLHLVSQQRSLGLGLTSFETAWREPERWRLKYRYAERNEQVFLLSITRLFGAGRPNAYPPSLDLWQRAHHDLSRWREQLSAWTLHAPHQGSAARLIAVLERIDEESPRNFLGRLLPAAFSMDRIPPIDEQTRLVDQLDAARITLERFLQGEHDRLAGLVYARFCQGDASAETVRTWLERGCRSWLKALHPGTIDRGDVGPEAAALRRAILARGGLEKRWFENLPVGLGMAPVAEWKRDESALFLARLTVARIELESWLLRTAFPLSPDPDQRRREVRAWMVAVLEDLEIPAGELQHLAAETLKGS
ncbi:MAG: hypothetical protein KC910_05730 [Candidatus Eremiobacteraeota bacterium]|nr:hypothetical protein [Candidatus Eremiobacteraeota bacterium]